MQKPSLGWQSWSPPLSKWHGFPQWDYSPFPIPQLSSQSLSSRRPLKHRIRYWCSWYAFGTKINDLKISQTVHLINQHHLPFTDIILDDGWTTWGDWQTPDPLKFPNFKSTLSNIQAHHLRPGLWLAPFLANSKSSLFRTHPKWFVYLRNRPIQGFKTVPLWNNLIPQQYLLNFEIPEVKSYLTTSLNQILVKWKVSLLKLDFLYAPYFIPHLKSPAVADSQLTWLLTYINRHFPSVTTITCGAPFHPTTQLSDIIRISKDTAWSPGPPRFLSRPFYHSRVKLLASKLTTLPPSKLNFDPDVRLVNSDNQTTTRIWNSLQPNLVLGIGDNLLKLSNKELQILKSYLE